MNFIEKLEDIKRKEETINAMKENLLLSSGWVRTCQVPTCCWMWTKLYKEKQILVDMETALEFEKTFSII
jgi:hypothetical protein